MPAAFDPSKNGGKDATKQVTLVQEHAGTFFPEGGKRSVPGVPRRLSRRKRVRFYWV
jgi:hypothetical protein